MKSTIDLVLVKRDMLRYVQDERAVTRMEREDSGHNVILCKVRLTGGWIKRREIGMELGGLGVNDILSV